MKLKAVFLDRDGTLIEHRPYLSSPAEIVILPGVVDALSAIRERGAQLFLFTNQSGVGRGYFSLGDVELVNRTMIEMLGLGNDLFTDICIATERPDELAVYRKPSPRFINEMLTRHSIPREAAWMVGDSPADWQAGVNAGIRAAAIIADPAQEQDPVAREAEGIAAYRSILQWLQAISRELG